MVGFCAAGAASGMSVVIGLRSEEGGVLTRDYRRDNRPELEVVVDVTEDADDVAGCRFTLRGSAAG
jgi:hypothetical protein